MRIKLNHKILKRLVWYCCVMGFLFIALAGGYVFVVGEELKRKIDDQRIIAEKENNHKSFLEQGSLTLRQEIAFFSRFLKPDPLKPRLDVNKFEQEGKTVLIKEAYELSPLLANDCRRYRCLQHRIPFAQIPSSLWKGLLGIEDFRFFQHQGIDYISIFRALLADIKAMSLVQGGSTLTQQLAKNLFLSNEKKLERKLREMIYALYLEKNFSKDEIITMYFN
ncbi:MAG: biosynthetic peptidoglycan transglycosylase, partial [Bacteriovoracaceae bacterium]